MYYVAAEGSRWFRDHLRVITAVLEHQKSVLRLLCFENTPIKSVVDCCCAFTEVVLALPSIPKTNMMHTGLGQGCCVDPGPEVIFRPDTLLDMYSEI